ncbi:C6 zinc finger domain-containing [Lecanosticta acicola]|uniref:C6 zinc finger domain-containing n=1 Tax=Lecanosticta acicola TaxID=111012 RepID=A0AAI8YW65_9PEZI|nr:C6 zinc finger domain-containing [Lecanosticta acicola]
MLRQTLNTYLNNIRQPVSFDESKRFTEEIESHLHGIPEWTAASSRIPSAMLSLNLRQYLLILHDRNLRVGGSRAEKSFSRTILIETATKMLDIHKSLTSKGIYALELLLQDQLRAALSLCHIGSLNPHADDALSRAIVESAHRQVPDAIEMLTDKIIRFGRELRQLWILLAAHGYMKSKKDPSRRVVYMQEAVDGITGPYYKIMACQEDAPAQMSGAAPPPRELPTAPLEYYPPSQQAIDTGMPPPDPGAMLDLDDIAAWTFEDWSFSPADLAAAFPETYPPPAMPNNSTPSPPT